MANNVGTGKMPLVESSSSSSSSDSLMDIMPIIMDSSSSSSSDGLSFVIDDSDDEIIMPVVQHFVQRHQDPQHLVFLLQLQQAAQELPTSASRPRAKKDASTETENKPMNVYTRTTLLRMQSTTTTIFVVDSECESIYFSEL